MTRTELERRPLVVVCLGLTLGLTLAQHPINFLFLLPAPWVLQALPSRVLLVVGLLVGAVLGPGPPPPLLQEGRFVDASWSVASLPKITPFGQRCEIESGEARLMLTYKGPLQLCPGSVVRVIGVARPPAEGTDQFFASRRLIGRITAEGDSVMEIERGPWLQRLGCAWRDRFLKLSLDTLPPRAAVATAALTFNADGLLDSDTRNEMQRTGTTHIIAASGFQVLVIGQGLLWLLTWLPIPRWAQIMLVGLVLAVYAIATGLHPPVMRATIMWLIANLAYVVRREPDWLSALAASSILNLVWKPSTVYEMGFQFSVMAVLFIGIFAAQTKWRPGAEAWFLRGLKRSLRGSLVAFVVVTPLIAYHFGVVSLISIPANLLVVAAVGPVVIVSMLAFPMSLLAPGAGAGLMKATLPLSQYIDSVLHVYGGQSAAMYFPPFSAYWLVPFYVLLLMLWRPYVRQP